MQNLLELAFNPHKRFAKLIFIQPSQSQAEKTNNK